MKDIRLSDEIAKVVEKRTTMLRPYVRDNLDQINSWLAKGVSWNEITESLRNRGVRDAAGQPPKMQAVWEAHRAASRSQTVKPVAPRKPRQTTAVQSAKPTAPRRKPRHSSKIYE